MIAGIQILGNVEKAKYSTIERTAKRCAKLCYKKNKLTYFYIYIYSDHLLDVRFGSHVPIEVIRGILYTIHPAILNDSMTSCIVGVDV